MHPAVAAVLLTGTFGLLLILNGCAEQEQEVNGHPAGHPSRATLRQPLPEQLCHHQPQGCVVILKGVDVVIFGVEKV